MLCFERQQPFLRGHQPLRVYVDLLLPCLFKRGLYVAQALFDVTDAQPARIDDRDQFLESAVRFPRADGERADHHQNRRERPVLSRHRSSLEPPCAKTLLATGVFGTTEAPA